MFIRDHGNQNWDLLSKFSMFPFICKQNSMESQNCKYSLEEKERLAVLVEKYKKEYDKEVEEKAKGLG